MRNMHMCTTLWFNLCFFVALLPWRGMTAATPFRRHCSACCCYSCCRVVECLCGCFFLYSYVFICSVVVVVVHILQGNLQSVKYFLAQRAQLQLILVSHSLSVATLLQLALLQCLAASFLLLPAF